MGKDKSNKAPKDGHSKKDSGKKKEKSNKGKTGHKSNSKKKGCNDGHGKSEKNKKSKSAKSAPVKKHGKPVPKKEDISASTVEQSQTTGVNEDPEMTPLMQSDKTTKKADNAGHSKSKSGDEESETGSTSEVSEKKEVDHEVSNDQVAEEASGNASDTVTESQIGEEVASKQFKAKPKKDKEKKHKEEKEKSSKKESEKLEFTKPTINQMVREEERKKHPKPPLVSAEKIARHEFEAFNDEVDDMNGSLQMLRTSYGSIIKSLVAMYTRRGKKGAQPPATVDGKVNFLTPVGAGQVQPERSILEWADKYDMERFINPATREEAFQALFAEVDLLNKKTEKLRAGFYDKKGYFLREKYDAQSEIKVTRKQLNEFWLWTRKLSDVIDEIARNYNDDLLNMFRLH